MKKKVNAFIEWFEDKFNFIIDIIALIGATFCILLGIAVFFIGIFKGLDALDNISIIIIPGVLGFFGIIMLFALRITRHLAKEND